MSDNSQDALEARFVEMVQDSWKVHNDFLYARCVDDQLTGAVISASVYNGYSLIDFTSNGNNHYLRFENLENKERLTFRLNHQTGDLERAKILGHLAHVTIGVGVPVNNVETLWSSFKQELKSSFIMDNEPGIMTLDADIMAKYLYAQVMLIWRLDDYFTAEWTPNFEKLVHDIHCTSASLNKYLQGRLNIGPAAATTPQEEK